MSQPPDQLPDPTAPDGRPSPPSAPVGSSGPHAQPEQVPGSDHPSEAEDRPHAVHPPGPAPRGPSPEDTPHATGAPAGWGGPAPESAPWSSSSAATVAERPWQRLDPRMLLVHPATTLLAFLPVLIGITLLGQRSGGAWQLVAVVAAIAIGLLQWVTTTYRVTETQVELRRNLVSRKVLTARLDRVRTVELTSPPLHRLLGLAKVQIGTGSSSDSFDLDSLRAPEAERLRVALLRLGSEQDGDTASGGPTTTDADGAPLDPAAADEVLLGFERRWSRYAAFTSSGAVVAAGLLGLASQVLTAADLDGSEVAVLRWASGLPLLPTLLTAFAVLLVLGAVFGVLGYLVNNWDFRLTRDAAGRTLRVRRGLLTTTETSLEVERVRGLELAQPLGIRLLGAGRLEALTVGSGFLGGGSTTIAPYSPREVGVALADRVVGAGSQLDQPLAAHGPVARRRRYVRALAPAVLLPLVLLSLAAWTPLRAAPLTWTALVAAVLLTAVGVPLAQDRYRRLGHALTPTHLITRRGSLSGAHTVLELDGIISWRMQQSFFQRRAGVATLVATTAAGDGSYEVLDVPLDVAVTLAHRADPRLLGQFTA